MPDFARLSADDARDMIDGGRATVLDIRDESQLGLLFVGTLPAPRL